MSPTALQRASMVLASTFTITSTPAVEIVGYSRRLIKC